MSPDRKRILKAWIPATIWLCIIILESTGLASSSNTSWILYPIFHYLTGVDRETFFFWNRNIRKTGHFLGYGVFSWLLFRAWRATLLADRTVRWTWRWAVISFFMAAFVASMDEWHQSYLPSRTGRWQDVVLDSSAALFAQVLLWFFLRYRAARATGSAQDATPAA